MIRYLIAAIYRKIVKPIFFRFDPEFVHDRITNVGKFLGRFTLTRWLIGLIFNYRSSLLVQTVAGVKFINPVGLSAGFDKNAQLVNILPSVGFGFMEIGSVTMGTYEGNPRPRLFRLPKSKGLVVYYGLKNDGVAEILPRIKSAKVADALVGISIAKTNCDRTADEACGIEDYNDCLSYVQSSGVGDYYTINVSCPNTFGGEPFTTKDKLDRLLAKLSNLKIQKPLFVKLPINLDLKDFDELLQTCIKYKITGVVIGNLTKVRNPELIKDRLPDSIKGGISGKPTWDLSNKLISYTYKKYAKKLVIIGVGGIFSAEDAYEKIRRGASLVQLITGLIFEGPQLVAQINSGLVKLMKRDGFNNISEAIGTYSSQD